MSGHDISLGMKKFGYENGYIVGMGMNGYGNYKKINGYGVYMS